MILSQGHKPSNSNSSAPLLGSFVEDHSFPNPSHSDHLPNMQFLYGSDAHDNAIQITGDGYGYAYGNVMDPVVTVGP